MSHVDIKDRAVGRWKSLLPLLGIESRYLSGKHTDCPICLGGVDRFRFDDKGGTGSFICSHCGAGNGIDLIIKVLKVPFLEAKHQIERHLGETSVVVPRAEKSSAETADRRRDQMASLWRSAGPMDGTDTASTYLRSRGIAMDAWPAALRVHDALPHYTVEKVRSVHPAMLAKFAAADGKSSTLHRTYLDPMGGKADVLPQRMLMPGPIPTGGAVRLFPVAETLGVGEGIETCLSAAALFGMPVWAALATGPLRNWTPPPEAKCVIVFGDNDSNYAGQFAAFALAYKLRTAGLHVEVRIPDEIGEDWNDVLIGRGKP